MQQPVNSWIIASLARMCHCSPPYCVFHLGADEVFQKTIIIALDAVKGADTKPGRG
jgi:hypothetical protein